MDCSIRLKIRATGGTTAWEHGDSANSVGIDTIPPGPSNRWKPVMFGDWNDDGWTDVGWWNLDTGNIVVNFYHGAGSSRGANLTAGFALPETSQWVPADFN